MPGKAKKRRCHQRAEASLITVGGGLICIAMVGALRPAHWEANVHSIFAQQHPVNQRSQHKRAPFTGAGCSVAGHAKFREAASEDRKVAVHGTAIPGEALARQWLSSRLAHSMANSASVGAVGAIVAALLSAITEPALNRVIVKRMTIREAIREVKIRHILAYFRTVLATNLLKFPFFEAVNTLTASFTGLPMLLRGVLTGVIYTSAMLPLANYRYAKSLRLQVDWKLLYQAYWPTLLRDIIYGITRTELTAKLILASPAVAASVAGRSMITFLAVACACVASAPGNELRAFSLQRKDGLPPKDFFKLERFVRSTVFSAVVCATALAFGQLLVGQAFVFRIWLHPIMPPLLLTLFCIQEFRILSFLVALFGYLNLAKARQVYDEFTSPRQFECMKKQSLAQQDGPDEPDSDEDSKQRGQGYGTPQQSDTTPGDLAQASVPTTQAVAAFVFPAFCNVLANSMMSAVDKMYIGRHSSLELAALGPAASTFDGASFLLTFLNTATMTLLGGLPVNSPEAAKVRSYALILASGAAVAMAGGLLVSAVPLCQLNGATRVMLPFSVVYLRLRAIGAPIERCTSVTTSFCFAAKDVNTPLFVTIIGLTANFILDGLLVERYGSAGVAVASVVASALGFGYLVVRLRRRGLWPSPLQLPQTLTDIAPFLGFAGPVLLAVFAKIMALNRITAAASALGTAGAAAHQIFMTLFFLCPVALGNPFGWAAQAFLPPLLARGHSGQKAPPAMRRLFRQALRLLIVSAALTSVVGSIAAVLTCIFANGVFVRDPMAVAELLRASTCIVPFFTLYPLFLTLEGALYAAQRRNLALFLSILFWLVSCTIISTLGKMGRLTLSTLWLGSGFACGLSVVLTLAVVLRVSRRAPRNRGRGGATYAKR